MRQQLHAVADSQYGQSALQHIVRQLRRTCFVDALRAAGEDQPARLQTHHLLGRGASGEELAVHLGFAHPPGNELAVLRPKVQYGDSLAGL